MNALDRVYIIPNIPQGRSSLPLERREFGLLKVTEDNKSNGKQC
jgi:hypothetical protein